jgi:hypothetical protein
MPVADLDDARPVSARGTRAAAAPAQKRPGPATTVPGSGPVLVRLPSHRSDAAADLDEAHLVGARKGELEPPRRRKSARR